jgi:predicted metal-binding protein
MIDRLAVEPLLREHGYDDFRWLTGADLAVRQWVRFKCMFGCPTYGKKAACPPAVPSVAECREFLSEYRHVAALHVPGRFERVMEREAWSREASLQLVKLERAVFLAGYPQVFALFMDQCRLCDECPGERSACRHPESARPSAEALGVDVFGTLRKAGYELQVLTETSQEMNRFAFLLVA